MKKVSFIKSLIYGFRFYIKLLPLCFISLQLIAILSGVLSGFSIFVHQYFFDSVSDVLMAGGLIRPAYLMLAALAALMLTQQVLNVINNLLWTYMSGRSGGEMAKRIHAKMIRLDPICLEDTNLHDDINKAQEGSWAVMGIISTLMSLFTFYIPYFLVMGFYFNYLQPRLLWVFALTFFPVLFSQVIRIKMYANYEDKIAPIRREYDYLYVAMAGKEYLKETRLLGGFSFLFKRFAELMKLRANEELRLDKRNALLTGITGSFSTLGYLGILAMLVQALLNGDISAGAFAAVFGAVGTLFSMMESIIGRQIGGMMRSLGLAHNFIRFMDLPERTGKTGTPDYRAGIVAENISFIYPQTDKKVLDGVTLTIPAGGTVAIVGENGAGKTTLARVLVGLYLPSEGTVQLHGLDTAGYDFSTLFDRVSGVFQRFQRYAMTLEENVRIGDVTSARDIEEALEQSGVKLDLETFPSGADTMLSREFGGVDLSGGQWQRVALARGLYRVHDLVILDEPTASIDPLEESRIYQQFTKIAKSKTAIIITHRLASAKMADKVVVMDKGKIAAIGTHETLLAAGGLYAEMYAAQAGWYSG